MADYSSDEWIVSSILQALEILENGISPESQAHYRLSQTISANTPAQDVAKASASIQDVAKAAAAQDVAKASASIQDVAKAAAAQDVAKASASVQDVAKAAAAQDVAKASASIQDVAKATAVQDVAKASAAVPDYVGSIQSDWPLVSYLEPGVIALAVSHLSYLFAAIDDPKAREEARKAVGDKMKLVSEARARARKTAAVSTQKPAAAKTKSAPKKARARKKAGAPKKTGQAKSE